MPPRRRPVPDEGTDIKHTDIQYTESGTRLTRPPNALFRILDASLVSLVRQPRASLGPGRDAGPCQSRESMRTVAASSCPPAAAQCLIVRVDAISGRVD